MRLESAILVFLSLVPLPASGPSPVLGTPTTCSVTITEPRPGQEVAAHLDAVGTATVPANGHLWLFARRASYRSLELWWPQGDGVVEASGHWKVLVSIGEARDVGAEFDITAAVFDHDQHVKLRDYFRNAARDGYKPMEMPAATCVATTVTVKKTRH